MNPIKGPIDKSTVTLPESAKAVRAYVAKINGVETIIAVPMPEPDMICGPLIKAKIISAKKINIGTIKYFDDCGSDPEICEGLIDVKTCVTIVNQKKLLSSPLHCLKRVFVF